MKLGLYPADTNDVVKVTREENGTITLDINGESTVLTSSEVDVLVRWLEGCY